MSENNCCVPKKPALTEEEKQIKRERSIRRMKTLQSHVFVCTGGCCTKKASAEEVFQAFKKAVEENNAEDFIRVTATANCLGRCSDACAVIIYPEGTWYKHVTPELAYQIVKEHLLTGKRLEDHVSFYYQDGKFNQNVENI